MIWKDITYMNSSPSCKKGCLLTSPCPATGFGGEKYESVWLIRISIYNYEGNWTRTGTDEVSWYVSAWMDRNADELQSRPQPMGITIFGIAVCILTASFHNQEACCFYFQKETRSEWHLKKGSFYCSSSVRLSLLSAYLRFPTIPLTPFSQIKSMTASAAIYSRWHPHWRIQSPIWITLHSNCPTVEPLAKSWINSWSLPRISSYWWRRETN